MSEKLNLFEKIQKVSEAVMNIEKDMTVGSGSYSYKAVSDVEVTLRVKKAEIANKLLSIPIKQELLKSRVINQVKNGKESVLFVDNIKMTVRFIDLEDTKQFIDIESLGKGVDSGDKGFGKASTYARKYALLNAYKIATGEDPDADKSPTVEPLTEDAKKDAIIAVCLKDEKIKNNVLSHFNLGSLNDLSKEDVKKIYSQFKAKKLL